MCSRLATSSIRDWWHAWGGRALLVQARQIPVARMPILRGLPQRGQDTSDARRL
ncbi:hypothetical protein ACW9HJ_35060 [Nocardia gipuzkoensis]